MSKYRKKPIEVEAVQWTGRNIKEIWNFWKDTENHKETLSITDGRYGSLKISINTLEGEMIVMLGDYIIKGINGEFYPCKEDIFLKTYDKIED